MPGLPGVLVFDPSYAHWIENTSEASKSCCDIHSAASLLLLGSICRYLYTDVFGICVMHFIWMVSNIDTDSQTASSCCLPGDRKPLVHS